MYIYSYSPITVIIRRVIAFKEVPQYSCLKDQSIVINPNSWTEIIWLIRKPVSNTTYMFFLHAKCSLSSQHCDITCNHNGTFWIIYFPINIEYHFDIHSEYSQEWITLELIERVIVLAYQCWVSIVYKLFLDVSATK